MKQLFIDDIPNLMVHSVIMSNRILPWPVPYFYDRCNQASPMAKPSRRLGAKGSYLTLVRVADRIL